MTPGFCRLRWFSLCSAVLVAKLVIQAGGHDDKALLEVGVERRHSYCIVVGAGTGIDIKRLQLCGPASVERDFGASAEGPSVRGLPRDLAGECRQRLLKSVL